MLLLLSGCRPAPSKSIDELVVQARQAFVQSKYSQAIQLIRRARTLTPAGQRLQTDQFRLMEAEYLLFSQQPLESLELASVPLALDSSSLDPRRQMLIGGALRRSRPAEAQSHLEAALASARQRGDQPTAAMAWILIGQIHLDHDRDSSKAIEAYRQAESAAKLAGDTHLERRARFNLGRALLEIYQFDLANELFRAAAAAARDQSDRDMEARAYDNLAVGYRDAGDYERALVHLEQADRIWEAIEDLPNNRIVSLGIRGSVLWRLQRRDEALGLLMKTASLARKRGEAQEIRRRLEGLIEPLLITKRFQEADRASAEVFALYTKNPALAEKCQPQSVFLRGRIHEEKQEADQARRDFEEALRLGGRQDPLLRRDVEFGLARLDTAQNRRPEARRHFEAAITLAEAERASLVTQDSQLTFLETVIDIYRAYAAALSQWGDENRALAVEESSRARLVSNRIAGHAPPLRLPLLRQLATRSRTVFLAYWIAESGSHVRIIGPEGYERVPLETNTAQLTALVREHNNLMRQQMADPRRTGRAATRLYELLVAPVAARIAPNGRVVVIPDGALHHLNFETLVRERNGEKSFWIEDVTVQVAPSLSMLEEEAAAKKAKRPKRLLLMGDAPGTADFPRLDNASAEMSAITRIVGAGAVTEHRGAAAQPAVFAASSPEDFSHIHFSAHAQANRESPLDSAVILSPDQTGAAKGRYRLTAREVSSLGLHADTVTISACRSAGDRPVQGEGMVGFAWAFLRAGAGNVIAALWDVNDGSTLPLMQDLYRAIESGLPATEALRGAKLNMIRAGKTYSKPFYWAPLQVYSRAVRTR